MGRGGRGRIRPCGVLTRCVQEGSSWTGHTAEAALVAALLQPHLSWLTGLRAHRVGSLPGAQTGQASALWHPHTLPQPSVLPCYEETSQNW